MAPAAHTSQTPANGNAANGAGITLGVRFTVSGALDIAAVSFYAPTTNTGTYTAGLWSTSTDDDPNGSGTGSLLQSGSLGSGSITPGAWNDIPLAAPVTCSPGTVYTAGVHTSSGQFVLTSNFYFSSGLTGNGVTLLQAGTDPNPPGLGSMVNGVFTEGGSLAYPNSSFNFTDYFIDVSLDDGAEPIVRAVGTAAETDSALPLGRAKRRAVGTTTETDAALALGRRKQRTVGVTAETDTALTIGRRKVRAIGTASSTEVALPIGRAKRRTLGTAGETDTAVAVGRTKRRAVGLAVEVDEALPITVPGSRIVRRPNTGTATRPASGTIARPFTGVVTRP